MKKFLKMDLIEKKLTEIRGEKNLSFQNLVSAKQISEKDFNLIFKIATEFKKNPTAKLQLLKNETIFGAFFENSTRTKSSFELAAKKLGADFINVSGDSSSIKKGETILDSLQTLSAYQPAAIVLRTEFSGAPVQYYKKISPSLINAGDGCHEHPSQSLIDAFSLCEHFQSKDLKNKKILIVGDILHSRVAGSLLRLAPKLGATIRLCAPATLLDENFAKVFGAEISHDLDSAIKNVDAVYNIRVQRERGSGVFISSLREYSQNYCVNSARFSRAAKNAALLDAGPVIRDLGIANELVEHPRSLISKQVENGLAIRKTLLWLLCTK